uniref:Hexosyltransferase n=1 Tax=Alexandrium monilatum TaxID=311494 RepID=A0A7S4SCK3_9DINO
MAMKLLLPVCILAFLHLCCSLRSPKVAEDDAVEQSEAYAFMLYGAESHRLGLTTAIYSIREFDQKRPIVVLTPHASPEMREDMAKLKASVIERPPVKGPAYCAKEVGKGKQRLTNSFFKMHVWNLTQFRTVLYLESDMLFRRPLTELFSRFREVPGDDALMIAGQGDRPCSEGDFRPSFRRRGWNTGIMAIRPSKHFAERYAQLLASGWKFPCFGGSQEFENILFHETLQSQKGQSHLICMPIKFNCKGNSCAQDAVVVHWTGERKPWDGAAGFRYYLADWEKQRRAASQHAGIKMVAAEDPDPEAKHRTK